MVLVALEAIICLLVGHVAVFLAGNGFFVVGGL